MKILLCEIGYDNDVWWWSNDYDDDVVGDDEDFNYYDDDDENLPLAKGWIVAGGSWPSTILPAVTCICHYYQTVTVVIVVIVIDSLSSSFAEDLPSKAAALSSTRPIIVIMIST